MRYLLRIFCNNLAKFKTRERCFRENVVLETVKRWNNNCLCVFPCVNKKHNNISYSWIFSSFLSQISCFSRSVYIRLTYLYLRRMILRVFRNRYILFQQNFKRSSYDGTSVFRRTLILAFSRLQAKNARLIIRATIYFENYYFEWQKQERDTLRSPAAYCYLG